MSKLKTIHDNDPAVLRTTEKETGFLVPTVMPQTRTK